MENKIYHIDKVQAREYLKEAKNNHGKIIEIDFKNITNWREYFAVIEKNFEFPRPVKGIHPRYMDWIRDLMWFDNDRYDVFFYHFKKLAKNNFPVAYQIYKDFREEILPFWEYEAPHCIVGGKTKLFNVYIVE